MKYPLFKFSSFVVLFAVAIAPEILAVAPQATSNGTPAPVKPDGEKAYEHIKFLASDAMKGPSAFAAGALPA